MELLFPVLIVLALCFYSLIRTLRNQKYIDQKSPPQAAGAWPLLGHLSVFSGPEPPHITLSNMADKYGPIFSIRLGVHRALVISSPEIAKESLNPANDLVFSDRPNTVAIQHMSYDLAMFGFSPYGPYWRELRKISKMLLLSNTRVAMYGEMIENEVTTMMTSIRRSCLDGGGAHDNRILLEMNEWFGDLNLNLIVRIVAGAELKKEMDSEKWKKTIREVFKLMGVVTLTDVIPNLKWFDCVVGYGKRKEFMKTRKDMDSMLQTWLDFHKGHKDNAYAFGIEEESFMKQMLDYGETVAQDFPSYDADTVTKATCQAMILGGTDTMTVTLTWALSLLLNNPHALRRAQDELDSNIGRGRRITRDDIKNIAYIKAILKETMRLYPAVSLSPAHIAREDCTLAGYHVRAGTRLFINTWKLHRDPCVWNNALEFVPERFLTDHKEVDVKGQHFELLPFGSGRRICPGISLSLQIMELVLANLLHGFDIETASDGPVDMSGSLGFTNMKATPLQVFLKPRLSPKLYL